jgi:glycosyltransferase involved in cell wall biosynthesis
MLSPTLEELLIPLSEAHFSEAEARSRAAGGRAVIDSTFPELAHLSPDYVTAAREAASEADVVIFSHPWIYPLVRDQLDRSRQFVVYDAHNVEGLLRVELLDDGGAGTEVARNVIRVERELCRNADLVLACAHDDRTAFNRLYGIPFERMRVFPNGTFTDQIAPATDAQRAAAREALNLGSSPVAFFIGSNYAPNVQAARFIADNLCPALDHVLFVVAGGVGDVLANRRMPFNLRVAGSISDAEKRAWLHASNVAVNPMFGGSGTNIKMLDYMAAGLPIIATPVGARGIETSAVAFAQAEPADFASRLGDLLRNRDELRALATSGRQQVVAAYSWKRLSGHLGDLLRRRIPVSGRQRPYFSVIVPTYERHASLTKLVECLLQQTCGDFELIIVDQSAEMWPERNRNWLLDLRYVFTDVRGAVRARNTGADLARGTVIAFVDDDCEPCPTWLSAARDEFAGNDVVGVEGLVESDRLNDPSWRAVTNRGFEGIAFLTANLMIRLETFQRINGFDIAFDNPHFREDTDLAWRALEFGRIPFSAAARVFHPPQPRSLERESVSARADFFQKDALLLRKHPVRYRELMYREAHWARNVYYWMHFLAGARRYQIDIPEDIRSMIPKRFRSELASHLS